MTNHRNPPKGPDWRQDWKSYGVLAYSQSQRKAVYARDQGICSGCGANIGLQFQADHILALHAIPPSLLIYPECLKFWSLSNLQTKGLPCGCAHRKTRLEASSNAKVKRIKARLDGTRRKRKKVPIRKMPVKKKKSIPSRHKPIISYILCKKPNMG